jgi:hypothetical protein
MIKGLDIFTSHMPAFGATATVQAAGAIAGATGTIPDGIPPLLWLALTLVGPTLTAFAFAELKARSSRRRARLTAQAAELRRCAEEHEAAAAKLLGDADSANDKEALALRASARAERIEAAGDEAEALSIENEMNKVHK